MFRSISCLRDYRRQLTPGTVLGLSYIVDDPGYLVRRALPIQQLTVLGIRDGVVRFEKQNGDDLRLALNDPITFLRFGGGPYDQTENILPARDVDDHDEATGPFRALRNDVAVAVYQVLQQHTQAINQHLAQSNVLAFWVAEGVLDAIRKHRASLANKQ